jgi:hypothetical protein
MTLCDIVLLSTKKYRGFPLVFDLINGGVQRSYSPSKCREGNTKEV